MVNHSDGNAIKLSKTRCRVKVQACTSVMLAHNLHPEQRRRTDNRALHYSQGSASVFTKNPEGPRIIQYLSSIAPHFGGVVTGDGTRIVEVFV